MLAIHAKKISISGSFDNFYVNYDYTVVDQNEEFNWDLVTTPKQQKHKQFRKEHIEQPLTRRWWLKNVPHPFLHMFITFNSCIKCMVLNVLDYKWWEVCPVLQYCCPLSHMMDPSFWGSKKILLKYKLNIPNNVWDWFWEQIDSLKGDHIGNIFYNWCIWYLQWLTGVQNTVKEQITTNKICQRIEKLGWQLCIV